MSNIARVIRLQVVVAPTGMLIPLAFILALQDEVCKFEPEVRAQNSPILEIATKSHAARGNL
jgi:hypothetical protein